MAVLGSIASALSGILGAVGAIVAAQERANAANQQADNELAAARAAEYQRQVAEQNAAISIRNAERSIRVSQIEQQDQDAVTRAMIGEQISLQGASGLALGGRSQLLTRKSAAALGRKDALNVRYAGEVQKYNYLVEAANQQAAGTLKGMEKESYERSAAQSRRAAGMSLLAGWLNAGASLLGTASSFAGRISGSSSNTLMKSRDPWAGLRMTA